MKIFPLTVMFVALGANAFAADYLVLAPHDLVDAWETYVEARSNSTAGAGLTFSVKDTAEIYAEYEGRNPAEQIHAYLRALDPRPKYVVLGGAWIDAQNLGAEQYFDGTDTLMTTNNCVPGVYAYCRYSGGMGPFPSDMFYACLDIPEGTTYPWDPNGDGYYLDDSENRLNTNGTIVVDYVPDIVVSRIPLKTGSGSGDYYYSGCALKKSDGSQYSLAELLAKYTAKLARGEASGFAGTGSVALLAGNAGCEAPENGLSNAEYKFYDGYPNLNDSDHAANSYQNAEMAVRRWLKELIAPYIAVTNVDLVTAGDYSNKSDLYNRDHILFWPSTHGDKDWLYTDGGYYSSVFAGAVGNSTGLTLFSNMAGPCDTGYPDCTYTSGGVTYGAPSFAEAGILAPEGGTLATIANSRVGVYDSSWSITLEGDAYSTRKAINAAKAFIEEGKNAGESWLAMAVKSAESSSSWTDTTMIYSHIEETLFGDPLVKAPTITEPLVAADGTKVYSRVTDDMIPTSGLFGYGEKVKVLGGIYPVNYSGLYVSMSEGGVGGAGVVFTNGTGTVTLTGDDGVYLAGVQNGNILVQGHNQTIDLDNSTFIEDSTYGAKIRFYNGGITNVTLRSRTEGIITSALDGQLSIAASAEVNLDTVNAFSSKGTIYLGNGATLKIVNSTEPLNAEVSAYGSGSEATILVASGISFEPKYTLPSSVALVYEDPDALSRYDYGNLASASAHGSYTPSGVTLTLAEKGNCTNGTLVAITNLTIAVDATGRDVAEYLQVNDVTSAAKVYNTTAYASGVYLVEYNFKGLQLEVGESYAVTFLDSSSSTITASLRFKLAPSTVASPLSAVASSYSTCARVLGYLYEGEEEAEKLDRYEFATGVTSTSAVATGWKGITLAELATYNFGGTMSGGWMGGRDPSATGYQTTMNASGDELCVQMQAVDYSDNSYWVKCVKIKFTIENGEVYVAGVYAKNRSTQSSLGADFDSLSNSSGSPAVGNYTVVNLVAETAAGKIAVDSDDGEIEFVVPGSFFSEYYPDLTGIGQTAARAAKLAENAANGANTVFECYALGLDPTDGDAAFTVTISFDSNGEPVIESSPSGTVPAGVIVIRGAESLGGGWHEKQDGDRFFKAVLEIAK